MSTQTDGRTRRAHESSRATPTGKAPARVARERRTVPKQPTRTRPPQHHIPGCNPDATPC
jgi:hypothetical protein